MNGRRVDGEDMEAWAVNGLAGNDTFTLSGGSAAIIGNLGTDTVVSNTPGARRWVISAPGAGTLDGRPCSGVERLTGGARAATFAVQSPGSVPGPVNGGAGTDVLDYSALGTQVVVNLQTRTASRAGQIPGVERAVGGRGTADWVVGPNTPNMWRVTGVNTGAVDTATGTFTFAGFESLQGGSKTTVAGATGADAFRFLPGGRLTGTVNGGSGGSNSQGFDGYGQPVTVNLATSRAFGPGGQLTAFANIQSHTGSGGTDSLIGPNVATTWAVTGPAAGTVGATAFRSFELLQGGTAADTFQVGGGSAVTVTGGAGADRVIGPAAGAAWDVTGTAAGVVAGIGFAQVETLLGGSGPDTFRFLPGGQIPGRIDGGAGANALDFSPFDRAVTIHLAQARVLALNGPVVYPVVNAFGAVQSHAGSPFPDTLVGPNLSPFTGLFWNVTGAGSGTLSAPVNVAFSGIENLTGGTNYDYFALSGGSVAGTITGAGRDQLRYGTSAAVSVNLRTGVATGVGRLAGIGYVFAGSGNDTLIGGAGRDSLYGGSGDDFIDGGLGNDLIVGEGGQDILVGGSGSDQVYGDVGLDFLVGGGLSYVNEDTGAVDLTAIAALIGEWSQSINGFLLRSFRLLGELTGGTNGSYVISSATVIADQAQDTLRGGGTSRDCLVRGSGPTDVTDFQTSLDEVQRAIG
jgi:Ca2+-binding RTX toxin-like protein